MKRDDFYSLLKAEGLNLNEEQLGQFHRYFELLGEWNTKMNLTGITDEEGVYSKHFFDSLNPFLNVDDLDMTTEGLKVCDVGSGAGFPGLPLKIAFPNLEIDLVDSLGKRIDFLNHVIQELDLSGIRAHHARAEELCVVHRETFDVVTSRAVARLNMLAELCAPLVRVGGNFIALKGPSGVLELEESGNGLTILGLEVSDVRNSVLDAGSRVDIYMKKSKATPAKYPRAFGMIKKRPLK